jgi:hypothetical protein
MDFFMGFVGLCSLYRNTTANAKSFAYLTNFFNTLPSRAIPLRMFSTLALPDKSRTNRIMAARKGKSPHEPVVGPHGVPNPPHEPENARTDGQIVRTD